MAGLPKTAMPSTSDDEREEEETRLERELRWAPTHTRWDLVPAVAREGPYVIRQRTDILGVYSDEEFREMYRFDKETFLRIVDIVKPDFPTGRNALSPEKRLGIFLSYVGGNEHQVKGKGLFIFVIKYSKFNTRVNSVIL